MDDNLIPLMGIICLFGLPTIGWILSRVMKHRERMAMLRMGMVPPPDGRNFKQSAGAPPIYSAYEDPNSAQCTMRRGLMTASVGFAILIGLSFIGYHGGEGPFSPAYIRPGPWLLGGLIPMFVGIAQIIIALLSGATLTFRSAPPQPPGSQGSPFQRSYGAPPSPQPPGPRYEELARPVPPPDRT